MAKATTSGANTKKKMHKINSAKTLTRIRRRWKNFGEALSKSKTVAYEVYSDFCKESSIHGLNLTVKKNHHSIERLLWILLVAMAMYGAFECCVKQWRRYKQDAIVVSLQRDYFTWWSTFPAVTVCFQDRVSREKATNIVYRIWNVTAESDGIRFHNYMQFLELIGGISFRSNMQEFWNYQADDTFLGVDLLELALEVHPDYELEVSVGGVLDTSPLVPVMTEMGVCFTYNSQYARYQFAFDEYKGPEALFRCHYQTTQCFVKISSKQNAVRFFVHSPYEIPDAVSNPTGPVTIGEELSLDFKMVEISASQAISGLDMRQRKCRYNDEFLSDKIQAYSYGLCLMYCRSRMALMFCGCRPFFHVRGDGKVCDAHGMACIGRNVELLINLPKDLAQCTCLAKCAELNYYSHSKKNFVHLLGAKVLPFGLELGILGCGVYLVTRLPKADKNLVKMIFGPDPASIDATKNPEDLVTSIAHRGAALDAPENTLEAFKYCVEQSCKFVELDVRSTGDGRLVLLHDSGLERVAGVQVPDIRHVDWDAIKETDVLLSHPNRFSLRYATTAYQDKCISDLGPGEKYPKVKLCLLDDALDFLLDKDMKMIIDIKGHDKKLLDGVVNAFKVRPKLYGSAAVTSFNPFVMYQLRRLDPRIVGAISYRPYAISAMSYDAESGPGEPRFAGKLLLQPLAQAADAVYALGWRQLARYCGASVVLLHKDLLCPHEVAYWRRSHGVRCVGWSVNRPLEKLYYRTVLRAPYLTNTLLGEPTHAATSKGQPRLEDSEKVEKIDSIEQILQQRK